MKKTLAILLAAVMLLAMGAVAMAATPTGNITVTGIEATSGMKATAYKIIGWNLDTDTNEPLDPANVWADSNIPTWLNTNGHSSDIKKYDGTDNNTENKVFNQMYQDLGIGLSLTSSGRLRRITVRQFSRDLTLVLTSSRLAAKTRSMSTARLSQTSVRTTTKFSISGNPVTVSRKPRHIPFRILTRKSIKTILPTDMIRITLTRWKSAK